MKQLLYFVPDVKMITSENLAKWAESAGIEKTMSGLSPMCAELVGPSGGAGALFTVHRVGEKGEHVAYHKDTQHWIECAGGKFWIGYVIAEKPGPDDLIRAEWISGYPTELADGNKWVVPMAIALVGDTRLPQTLSKNSDGELVKKITPEHQEISRLAEIALDNAEEEKTYFETVEEGFDVATMALALNYHVDEWVISLLDVLTTPKLQNVMESLIDMPMREVYLDALKKNESLIESGSNDSDAKPIDGSVENQNKT